MKIGTSTTLHLIISFKISMSLGDAYAGIGTTAMIFTRMFIVLAGQMK
jgi:hypothetical protein